MYFTGRNRDSSQLRFLAARDADTPALCCEVGSRRRAKSGSASSDEQRSLHVATLSGWQQSPVMLRDEFAEFARVVDEFVMHGHFALTEEIPFFTQ